MSRRRRYERLAGPRPDQSDVNTRDGPRYPVKVFVRTSQPSGTRSERITAYDDEIKVRGKSLSIPMRRPSELPCVYAVGPASRAGDDGDMGGAGSYPATRAERARLSQYAPLLVGEQSLVDRVSVP